MIQMFDISEKVDSRTIRWDLWSDSNWLGRFFMETFIFGWWWRSHQSLAHESLRIPGSVLCLGKMNQNPQSNTVWEGQVDVGSRVHHNTELWTQLMVSQWNSSGTFSQDSPHCSSSAKSWSSCQNERKARRIYRTDHLHVDVQRHLMGISRQWTGMRISRQPRFYLCGKIFSRKMVLPRTWIRKEVVFYSW